MNARTFRSASRLRLAAALLACFGLLGCEVEEELRIAPDGSGSYRAKLSIAKELAPALSDVRQEAEKKGFRVLEQGESEGRRFIVLGREFRRVAELNDREDSYFLEVGRGSIWNGTYHLTLSFRSNPAVSGFRRTMRVVMPTSIRQSSAGTVSEKTVQWDCSGGGTLTLDASGLVIPLNRQQLTTMTGVAIVGLAATLAALFRRRKFQRRCTKCDEPPEQEARFCPACGTALEEDRSKQRSRRAALIVGLSSALALGALTAYFVLGEGRHMERPEFTAGAGIPVARPTAGPAVSRDAQAEQPQFAAGVPSWDEPLPPKPEKYVTDRVGILGSERVGALSSKLEQLDHETSNQILVWVDRRIPENFTLEDFALRAFNKWGVGQAQINNGAVLFVFVDDRKLRIEVGAGLQGSLPDATAKRIIDEEIVPRFRSNDYAAGVEAGVTAMIAATKGEYRSLASVNTKGSWTGTVRQPGYPSYSVEMTITAAKPGEPAGTVTYPELNCSGTLRCEGINGTSITLREKILENRDGRCVDGVKIVMTVESPQSTTAAIAYFMPNGNPAGTAELSRIDAQ